MRVLGVDPGTLTTGWGVVDERQSRFSCIESGIIRARGELPKRLQTIHQHISRVLAEFLPSFVSIEKTFVGENVQSAFRLGEARGAILLAAAQADVPVVEYSPAEVKVSVAGAGRAGKEQVQTMIRHLLSLQKVLVSDEADALAVALCHLHTRRFATLITLERNVPRTRNRRRAWEEVVLERAAEGTASRRPR